jgi:CBS domain-containing protein
MICPNCGWDNLPGNEVCDNCHHDLTALDRPMGWNKVEKGLLEDEVQHLQKRLAHHAPFTILPSASVDDAVQVLLQRNVGALLVVDEQGKLRGIFSERDLLNKVAAAYDSLAGLPVSDIMTANPESVGIHDHLAFVLHKMDVGGYRHLPIVENGKPVGIISVRDMLRYITRLCETI